MSTENKSEQKEEQPINVADLPIQSLRQLQQQVTEQYEWMSRNVATLKMARNRFANSKSILDSYTDKNNGKETMIPLTDSLYVTGHIHTKKVLVDLGVGYYAERTPKEAKAYFGRKVKLVQSKVDELSKKMHETENSKEQIDNVLRGKVNEELARQAQTKNVVDKPNAFLTDN